jgi:type IV secretion system protein VirD4
MMMTAPILLMGATTVLLRGSEHWLSAFGTTEDARMMLGRGGIALPYIAAAALGVVFLFAAAM